jgi:hypothetical protein
MIVSLCVNLVTEDTRCTLLNDLLDVDTMCCETPWDALVRLCNLALFGTLYDVVEKFGYSRELSNTGKVKLEVVN